jgi:predicted Zn-dependent protease
MTMNSRASIADLVTRFAAVAPACEEWSIRLLRRRHEALSVTRGTTDPIRCGEDLGAMVTVTARFGDQLGAGYGATSDITAAGLARAGQEALGWAKRTAGHLVAVPTLLGPSRYYDCVSPPAIPWHAISQGDKLDRLHQLARTLKRDDRITHWQASLYFTEEETVFGTSAGNFIREGCGIVVPGLEASASAGGETQTRTFGRGGAIRQGGLEQLDELGFWLAAPRVAEEALVLLEAPDCPTGTMDLLLAPDQMFIQIHESIGHPLELDRILGDERNYAGTSFVTLDMFGSYQYGSPLLNVTFDPNVAGEAANYAYDDMGSPAERCYLIRNGVLQRALGGALSQARANTPGAANARACSWNRPPIDRMANLNIEPGASTFEELVAQVEDGILMETNSSWSIDDSRNKFQFGCERARLIKDGQFGPVVKNPNYRGVSASFWRSLKGLGTSDTVRILGTPTCGKGEPNQAIRVGHATPPGLFAAVQVFGGG